MPASRCVLLLVADKAAEAIRAERTLWYVSTARPKANAVYDQNENAMVMIIVVLCRLLLCRSY